MPWNQACETERHYYNTHQASLGTIRASCYGHSISFGQCSDGTCDGWRALAGYLLYKAGYPVRWYGDYGIAPETSEYSDGLTSAHGGDKIADTLVRLDNLATILPTPTANDWIFLGPALTNDATAGASLAYMEGKMTECINKIAAYGGMKIFVVNDTPRFDGVSLTNALTAATNAYNAALSGGKNVVFIDANSCVLLADMWTDNLHLTRLGNEAWATRMVPLITAVL